MQTKAEINCMVEKKNIFFNVSSARILKVVKASFSSHLVCQGKKVGRWGSFEGEEKDGER